MLEHESAMLEQRIDVAQEALLTRWLELTQRRGDMVEIRAIVEASEALRDLKRQWFRKHRAA
jgi:ABC-type transporter Mla MlaB component